MNNSINDIYSYDRAKNILEPYVKAAFEELDYIVRDATIEEDMHHVDLYIIGKNNIFKKPFGIDVKGRNKNINNSNKITFTKISKTGKVFIPDPNNFFAFVNENIYEIYIINQVKFFNITADFTLHKSKRNNSKFIWLDYKFLKDNAVIIVKPSDKLNLMLNN